MVSDEAQAGKKPVGPAAIPGPARKIAWVNLPGIVPFNRRPPGNPVGPPAWSHPLPFRKPRVGAPEIPWANPRGPPAENPWAPPKIRVGPRGNPPARERGEIT